MQGPPEHPRNRSAEEVLRAVAEGTAQATGEDFFRALAQELPAALELRYCFLTRCLGTPPSRVATLAFWSGESFLDNFEYDLVGTPCQGVVAGEACVYPCGIQALFPEDQDLVDLEAESYAAVPFQNAAGEIIGHLAVLDVKELEEDSVDLSILKIFAARAGAELERLQASAALEATERTLRQAQKVESLGALAGGFAHDFNNLLTGVLGNAELALAKLSSGSARPARARDNVGEILTAATRAAELSEQMLAYSGQGRFSATTNDLMTAVDKMRDLLYASVDKKAVLKLEPTAGLPAVGLDAAELQQVVLNLVTNASDALAGGTGVISITSGFRDLDPEFLAGTYLDDGLPGGLYVVLEVSDTGHGMDQETRERMFDPFFSTRPTGRGLGLAVVLGIVRGHRGAIEVDSCPDHGTAVRVFLPAASAPAPPPPAAPEPPAVDGAGRTVLIVDDDPGVRIVAGEILQNVGFEIVAVEDGLAAISTLRRRGREIAAVLLDMTMPHLDGPETVRELRRLQPELRVVFTSGYSEQEVSRRLGDKPEAFIQKPFFNDQLLRVIAVALDGDEAGRRAGDRPEIPAHED